MTGRETRVSPQRPAVPQDGTGSAIGHLVIRADASEQIGAGHLMRCIALGQAWHDHGGRVTVISHCRHPALRKRVADEGFEWVPPRAAHPHPEDLETTLSVLDRLGHPWLALDGYHFDGGYQTAVRKAGHRLLVIDDTHHLPAYHADIVLNQNIYAPSMVYQCDADTEILLGCQYVMLRREFVDHPRSRQLAPETARRILVTLGGADPENDTLRVVRALKRMDAPQMEARIIVGPANPYVRHLFEATQDVDFSVDIIQNPDNMPTLMAWADMAISAAGGTCWELAFLGVPNLMLVIADNQRKAAEILAKQGAAIVLDRRMSMASLADTISETYHNKQLRTEMTLNSQKLVDGGGRDAVVRRLMTPR